MSRVPLRRLLAAALAALCLCAAGLSPSALAAEDSGADFVERFGWEAEVVTDENGEAVLVNGFPTRDENGEAVLVNGFPTRRVRAGFNNRDQEDSFQYELDFVDYPFWRDATAYDGNLAVMSLEMALSANRAKRFEDVLEEDFDPSLNLEHFLSDAGFEDIRKDDYSKTPTMYTVSTAMGYRRMEHEGEEPFTLVAVGVCGGGYKNEWQSNLTPGTGELHEGFSSAASLVVDRLMGYIATRGLEGRVKVWIAGFSRAAAVSNLTAGMLTDAGVFPVEDVFAYTFATPAAVKDPPAAGHENIFNIINPMDLVPQVMPSDWGYGRYGTDLYLSVQEFSSYLGSAGTETRAETDRTVYGIENNYSPALNLRMRLLLSLVMDVAEDRAYYNEYLQPALVGIMQDKTVPNALTTLRELMLSLKDTGAEGRADLDALMDYFLRVFSDGATRTELAGADVNTGSVLFRLMSEHTENSYLSCAELIRGGWFEPSTAAHYVMVRGPVTVTLLNAESGTELIRMTSDGTKSLGGDWDELGLDEFTEMFLNAFYMERRGDTSVIGVPADVDYEVVWTAERGGTVACVQALFSVKASARYPGAASAAVRVSAGDTGVAFQSENGRAVLPEGFAQTVFSGWDLAKFMGIVSLGVNWRLLLTALCALLALAVCVPLCAIAARRRRHGFLTWLTLCVFGVAALETEAAFWFFADRPVIRLAWKAAVALCLIVLYLRVRRPEGGFLRSLLPALLLAAAADIVISVHFVAGAALFLLCHLALILRFQREKPLSRGRWIQWAVVSLPLAAMILLFFAPERGASGWAAAVYAPVLLLMGFSAAGQPRRERLGAMLLVLSDLMMGLFVTLLGDPALHAAYMLLFYLGLLLLALGRTENGAPAPAAQTASAYSEA